MLTVLLPSAPAPPPLASCGTYVPYIVETTETTSVMAEFVDPKRRCSSVGGSPDENNGGECGRDGIIALLDVPAPTIPLAPPCAYTAGIVTAREAPRRLALL
jgi:hypothetical protein